MRKRLRALAFFVFLLTLGTGRTLAQATPPSVARVEPSSWWSAPAAQELTLVVEGSGLKGATVTADRPGVEVTRVECPGEGSALFVGVSLEGGVKPGPVALEVRGIPQLTWGDEVNLPGLGDDRKEFPGGWPGGARDAFSAAGRIPEEQATFEAYRKLLRIRKQSPAFRRGTMTELVASDAVFAVAREHEGERVLVVLNFGPRQERVAVPWGPAGAAKGFDTIYGEGRVAGLEVEVPGERAVVLRAR